jgi:hypothetical protein
MTATKRLGIGAGGNANSPMVWGRIGNSPADPGGQMFGGRDSLPGSSRNTITALGLAGGAPRIADVALYAAVPEPPTSLLGAVGIIGLGVQRRSRRQKTA